MKPSVLLRRFNRSIENSFERDKVMLSMRGNVVAQVDEGAAGQNVIDVGCSKINWNCAKMQGLPRLLAHVILQQNVLDHNMQQV